MSRHQLSAQQAVALQLYSAIHSCRDLDSTTEYSNMNLTPHMNMLSTVLTTEHCRSHSATTAPFLPATVYLQPCHHECITPQPFTPLRKLHNPAYPFPLNWFLASAAGAGKQKKRSDQGLFPKITHPITVPLQPDPPKVHSGPVSSVTIRVIIPH